MKKFLLELLKIVFISALLLAIAVGVWIYYRGTRPMEIPDARGITFWQFIRERWQAHQEVDGRISALPQYLGCRNDVLRMFPLNFGSAVRFAYASYNADSKLAYAFRYWEEKQQDLVLPRLQQVNLAEIPDAFWRYFERAYWRGLVSIDYLAGECQLGPVNFDTILKGAEDA